MKYVLTYRFKLKPWIYSWSKRFVYNHIIKHCWVPTQIRRTLNFENEFCPRTRLPKNKVTCKYFFLTIPSTLARPN